MNQPEPPRTPLPRRLFHKSLRYSFWDGSFVSCMAGFTQEYFSPFLLLLGATAGQVGLLNAMPNLVGSLVQLKTADAESFAKSRRKVIVTFVFLQALTLLILCSLILAGIIQVVHVLVLVTFFAAFGAFTAPAWGSLMSDLVPAAKRGMYFGWRNRIFGFVNVGAMLAAGWIVQKTKGMDAAMYGFAGLFACAFLFRLGSWQFLRMMHEPRRKTMKTSPPMLKDFLLGLRKNNFARFAFFVALTNFAVCISGPYFAVLMIRDLHFSYVTYTTMLAANTLTSFLAMRRWGVLADKFGNVKIMRWTAKAIAIIPFLWFLFPHPVAIFLIQAFSGIAWSGFGLCASNFIFDACPPATRTRSIAYFNVLSGVFLAAGALAGAGLLHYLPPLRGFNIMTLLLVSGTLRVAVAFMNPLRFDEVRKVQDANSVDLFFGLLHMRPLFGMERRALHDQAGDR